MDQDKIIVLIHIYYKNSYDELKVYLLNLKQAHISIVFKIDYDFLNEHGVLKQITADFPEAFIIHSPNIGKDIGGKLAMIDLCLKLNLQSEYFILLHDKKSPHSSLGDVWRNKLFKIIEPGNILKIKKIFEQDEKVGLIGTKEFISNEYDKSIGRFEGANNEILKTLIQKYQLDLKTYDFIGGTMFWIRSKIIYTFFSKYAPLDILSTLEKGNVLDSETGTHTHAWERILSWISTDQGYKIKGI
jgi:lipopolysaccharide biosynthesis protein